MLDKVSRDICGQRYQSISWMFSHVMIRLTLRRIVGANNDDLLPFPVTLSSLVAGRMAHNELILVLRKGRDLGLTREPAGENLRKISPVRTARTRDKIDSRARTRWFTCIVRGGAPSLRILTVHFFVVSSKTGLGSMVDESQKSSSIDSAYDSNQLAILSLGW